MKTSLLEKLGINKLWMRLAIVVTLVTLLALIVAFSMSIIGMRNEVKRYVDIQFGPLPDSVSKQLSAYYGQSNGWDGVEVSVKK